MTAYYNEIDPYAAQWLRNLITAGHIAPGVVDERSIEDVTPADLDGFTQCHFFAGVGVWSLALRRAGWPDDRPVWTGSCPCQPFSSAGAQAGFADERHLWPHFFRLIQECRPTEVFGEQVASKAVEPWIDLVQADMEAVGYGVGCVAFPSAGVGAPHIRDRVFWVGHAEVERERRHCSGSRGPAEENEAEAWKNYGIVDRGPSSDVLGFTSGFWKEVEWLECSDGKRRPVEPGTFPLANGATARVGRLRAYGNAINAEAAKEFIAAFLDCAN